MTANCGSVGRGRKFVQVCNLATNSGSVGRGKAPKNKSHPIDG